MNAYNATKKDIAFWTGYYEEDGDYFQWASNKAYLDMNRTLTFSKSDKNKNEIATEREEWKNEGTKIIRTRFEDMKDELDNWHKETCDELIKLYNSEKLIERKTQNPTKLTYGQAQKWLNMTLKYLWLLYRVGQLSECDAKIIKGNEKRFHVPLDSYILRYIARRDKSRKEPFGKSIPNNGLGQAIDFDDAWSKINEYSVYEKCQTNLRNSLEGYEYPLEWELIHWHKALKYYG